MRKPTVTKSFPTLRLKEESLIPGFASAMVACLPETSCAVYQTAAAAISTSFDGSMYCTTPFSTFFVIFAKWFDTPLCAAPCSKAALQASLYVGPAFTQMATINGPIVINKGYHYATY